MATMPMFFCSSCHCPLPAVATGDMMVVMRSGRRKKRRHVGVVVMVVIVVSKL